MCDGAQSEIGQLDAILFIVWTVGLFGIILENLLCSSNNTSKTAGFRENKVKGFSLQNNVTL